MNRTEKEEAVASLHKTFEDASLVVVAHYTGLTVAEMSLLRGRMRKAGAAFKVTKNRLTRRALEGTKYKPLEGMFTGPTAIAYSKDPVAAAKAAIDFAKTNEKLVVVGGALGDKQLDLAGVTALASLPSLQELRGMIVGMIQTPATRIAGILQAPGGQIARVLSARAKSGAAA
ncbi:MAG: 50S ribosomal protein L10 [Rhodospirillales bacterium RIFCSPLOWO2_01_FULL_65_14]|nr:MAG: 50S ribosomal protein L10 [Rhodospirillales bacterium RIFCSPLOWO2_01_FULL_65_14]